MGRLLDLRMVNRENQKLPARGVFMGPAGFEPTTKRDIALFLLGISQ
jgi:hypothetical protein